MPNTKMKTLIALAALFLLPLTQAEAQQNTVDLKGTDSAGSFSFDAAPAESAPDAPAEQAAPPAAEGSKTRHHGMAPHGKGEGSKTYAHKKKKCDKDKAGKEGSASSDPHKKDCDKAHAKKEGSGHHAGKYGHGSRGYAHGGHGKHGGYGKKGHSEHGGHGGHGMDPFMHVLRFQEKLGLTDAQVEAMKDAQFDYKKERVMAHADHKVAHMQLDKLVHSGNLAETTMTLAADQIAASKARSIHAMVNAKIALLKILTEEQRAKMKALHAAHSGD